MLSLPEALELVSTCSEKHVKESDEAAVQVSQATLSLYERFERDSQPTCQPGHPEMRAIASGAEGGCWDGGRWPELEQVTCRFQTRFPTRRLCGTFCMSRVPMHPCAQLRDVATHQ